MQTEDFLKKIVPAQGVKCVATLSPEGWFRHYFSEEYEEAATTALFLSEKGENVYFALASYHTDKSRKGTNVRYVQSFWLDIDCGEAEPGKPKPYATQLAGVQALNKFVKETGLPAPMVVSSGNGIHVYWPLLHPITGEQWDTLSLQLRQLVDLTGFVLDHSRTKDSSSVLRPVGTRNPKGGKVVRLLRDADQVDPKVFEALLHGAIERFGELPGLPPQKKRQLNTDLTGDQDYPPASAYQIADRCAQLTHIRDTLGNVEEPLWYAAIGLLRYTTEGEPLIQEWSSGHPDYSDTETTQKIRQHEESGARPTTCTHFQSVRPAGCVGCPHAGKVNSPITLGYPEPQPLDEPPVAADGEVLPDVPRGYQRTDKGLCVLVADASGNQSWKVFCPYDLYPVARLRVEGKEVVRLRAKFPLDGWREFNVEVGVIASSPKDLTKVLGEGGVALKPMGVKHMPGYLIDWINKLQREKEAIVVYDQMGWQEDDSFVIGTRRYLPDGTTVQAALSERLKKSGAEVSFGFAGDLDQWKRGMQAYARPGMEQYQFVIGASLGSPLMRFTQQDGALIHILSEGSAQGKTTAEIAALSVFGFWKHMRLNGNDTQNAFFNRLSSYGSLPGVVDELAISDKFDPRAFVHVISQGKERGRLRPDGTERNPNNTWCTLVVASSNSSIAERLAASKSNPEAEIARIFEYYMKLPKGVYTKAEAEEVFGVFRNNYGHAGDLYLQWVVQHQDKAAQLTRRFQARFDKKAGTTPTERFWSATVGCVLAGLYIASKLSLISWNLGMIEDWVVGRVNDMRALVHESVRTPLDVFGSFLNENINHTLVVDRAADLRKNQGCQILNANIVRGPLKIRIERNVNRAFISKRFFNDYATERGVNITGVRKYLQDCDALARNNVLKSLGHGTEYATIHVPCWEVDLSVPELSGLVDLSVVDKGATNQQQPKEEVG